MSIAALAWRASVTVGHDGVNQTILYCFTCREETVALGVSLDLFKRLARMLRHQFVHACFHFQDFAGVDFDIRRLPW